MTLRILLRRSKSEGQEHSLDVQRAGCVAFATARGVSGPAVEYVGDGVAGDDIEGLRALRRLLDEVNPGDAVVCRDHSRLGRDMLESTLAIRTLISDGGARLFYYSTGEEVRFANAADQAMTVLRGFGAQSELENIRARTKEAMRSRVKAGRLAGGACYGYRLVRVADGAKEHTIAVINEAEAAIILRIFAEYLDGDGLKLIAIRLNNEGVPGVLVKRRGSGSWSPNQVRDILRRERYRGVYVHGVIQRVKKGGKRIAKKADPSEVLRVEVPEWRIVDDVTWYRAQATFVARAPTLKSTARATNALSGIGRCASCGGSISVVYSASDNAGGTKRAYGCVRHRQRGPAVCPVSTRRPVEAVERALANAIREVCRRPDVVEAILSAARAELAAETASAGLVDTAALRGELADVRREHRNLVRTAAALDADDPELLGELRQRRDRIVQIEKAIEAAERQPSEGAAMLADMETALRDGLEDLREVLDGDAAGTQELYRALFPGGLRFETHPTAKPARWIITGELDLVKRPVTPTRHAVNYQGARVCLVA